MSIGAMTEWLTVQRNDAETLSLSSLTRSGTTATATTTAAHGYATGDYVTVAGASPSGYNGKVKITVTGTTTFTYVVSSGLSTPATGGITVVYVSDAQGGRRETWRTLGSMWGTLVPLRGTERLQLAAIQSDLTCRFRVRVRADLSPTQRVRWTPSWPPSSPERVFEINGIVPDGDGRTFVLLECAQSVNP